MPASVQAEFSRLQSVIDGLQNELSSFRSGHAVHFSGVGRRRRHCGGFASQEIQGGPKNPVGHHRRGTSHSTVFQRRQSTVPFFGHRVTGCEVSELVRPDPIVCDVQVHQCGPESWAHDPQWSTVSVPVGAMPQDVIDLLRVLSVLAMRSVCGRPAASPIGPRDFFWCAGGKIQVHQNHFHQKNSLSKSNFIHVDTFIKNHFHQKSN